MLLKDKVALITGASKGIGCSTARLFEAEGAILVLTSRTEAGLSAIKSELKFPNRHFFCLLDVASLKSVDNLFVEINKQKIILDILINNAGIMLPPKTFNLIEEEDYNLLFNTNVLGTMHVIKYALKHFLRKRQGSIINISSILGTKGTVGQSVYSSSKSALLGFTMSLSKELAPINIRVNCVAPGFIETDMTTGIENSIREKTIASIGMKRIGKPEDVSKVILFLASNLSDYVTGQTIGVDGGMVI